MLQVIMLIAYALPGVGYTPAKIVDALHLALDEARERTLAALMQCPQPARKVLAIGGGELRCTGRRRCTHIGNEVGNREVRLMADTANHRDRTSRQRARDDLLVEGPEVFYGAATATQDQQIALAARRCSLERCDDALGGPFALYPSGINHDRNSG